MLLVPSSLTVYNFQLTGASTMVVASSIEASRPPFPAFVLGHFVAGISLALQDSLANSFVACLREKASLKMGILHAVYGTIISLLTYSSSISGFMYTGCGALTAPLVATQFAPLRNWSFHYLCTLGLALTNVVLLPIVFKFKRLEGINTQLGIFDMRLIVHRIDRPIL